MTNCRDGGRQALRVAHGVAPTPFALLRACHAFLCFVLRHSFVIRASSFAIFLLLLGCRSHKDRVVVYCAHDREFAEPILKDFTKETGLDVVTRWDTEANKSVGLYEDLLRERDLPRCDVHWNNEILATIRLQRQGLLQPYDSPSAAPFPAAFKAKDHTWTGFAARARVFVINTKLLPERADWPNSMAALADPKWRGKFAMARPQFGTTATQAACVFHLLGSAGATDFFQKVRENNVILVPGNKQVAVAVGKGQAHFGITDTDDAFAEIDAGNPVGIIFPDLTVPGKENDVASKHMALFIPNTVAMIKGSPNANGGKTLIDYLLRSEVEIKLAKSASRQIPLNSEVNLDVLKIKLPDWRLYEAHVDFDKIADRWDEAQQFLTKEFAGR